MAEEHSHHSDAHGHHHHHHHRSHHKHQPKTKLGQFFRKHKNLVINLGIILLAVVALAALIVVEEGRVQRMEDKLENNDSIISGKTDSTIQLEVPAYQEENRLVGTAAWTYLQSDIQIPAVQILARFRQEGVRLDVGLPVRVSYDVLGMPQGLAVAGAKVEVADNAGFLKPVAYELAAGVQQVNVYHLKTNTTYYYRISLYLTDNTTTAVQGSFRTADTPRLLGIDGIVNVRDIGGWKTLEGKRVRQGLLIRGSELDGAVERNFKLTNEGKATLVFDMGIRTDMDLRSPNVGGQDALGNGVEHIYYDAPAYDSIFTDSGKEAIRRIFTDLADPAHYPVYLHCTLGADRTGTACWLLEAVLGLSEEDLLREYELTALYRDDTTRTSLELMLAELERYEGRTVQEKAVNYLLSAGVTNEQLESIRNILLED